MTEQTLQTNTRLATPAANLGDGYNSDTQTPTRLTCLKQYNAPLTTFGKVTEIDFSNAITFDRLQKALNIDVKANAKIGKFSADLSSSYAREIEENDYSISFHYVEKVILGTKKLKIEDDGTNALNNMGKSKYARGGDEFRRDCGDEIIYQADLEAGIYVTLKVNFHNYTDKETFKASMGMSIGSLGGASGSISSVISQYNLQANIEILAIQIGGNGSKLAEIFDQDCTTTICPASCSLDKLDDCQKIIKGVVDYAAHDFSDQLTLDNAAMTNLDHSLKFSSLDLNVGPSILNSTIIDARNELGSTYDNFRDYKLKVNHIANIINPLPADKDVKAAIQTEIDNMKYNIELLENDETGAIACYNAPETCPSIAEKINSETKPLNPSFLDQFKNGYSCPMDDNLNYYHDKAQCLPIGNNKFIVNHDGQSFVYYIDPDTSENLKFTVGGHTCIANKIGENSYKTGGICRDCFEALPFDSLRAHHNLVCWYMENDNATNEFTRDDFMLRFDPIETGWLL